MGAPALNDAPNSEKRQSYSSPLPFHSSVVVSACGGFAHNCGVGTQRLRLIGWTEFEYSNPGYLSTGCIVSIN